MCDTPEISIIVPIYNVEKYLNKCVDSILNQTFTDFELILVDDESPDNCGSICEEYARQDSRVKVIHKKNGGLSSARNAGIDIARGKFLGFVDSDDYIAPDMYETLYNNLINNGADISVCGVYNCYNGNKYPECSEKVFMILNTEEALKEVLIGEKFSVPACNKIYKKNLFNDVRYPIGKLSEDAFTTPTLISKSSKVVVTTVPKYYYVHRKGSITSSYFKMNDFDVVEAYKINLKLVESRFPNLYEPAVFRCLWSYMYVLDKMILTPNLKQIDEYNKVIKYIRGNTFKILKIPYFTTKRKIATIVLLFSKSLYKKICTSHHNDNMKLFDECDNEFFE